MSKHISQKRDSECCSQDELKKFEKRVEEIIHPGPDSTRVGEGVALSAYWEILSLSNFCGCQVITILEAVKMRDLWRWALSCGRLSAEQVRYIGEQEHFWGWSNLLEVVERARIKRPSVNTIFSQPFNREDVIEYLAKVQDSNVIAAGIDTGALLYDDLIDMLVSEPEWLKGSGVQSAMIKTKLLTQEEVLELVGHYDGQCLDHLVRDYLKAYEPRGEQLQNFLEAVVLIDPKAAKKIYEDILEIPGHGLSGDYILELVSNGELKLSSSKAGSSPGCF